MDLDQTEDAIGTRISVQGIKIASFIIPPKQLNPSRLKTKVSYLRSLSTYQSRRSLIQKKSRNRVSTVDVFKQLVMNLYISDGMFMASVLRSLVESKGLREPLNCLQVQQKKVFNHSLSFCLREIFKRKKYQRMSEFFYRLSFQPRKKQPEVQTVLSPRRRTVVIEFAPSAPRKSIPVKSSVEIQKKSPLPHLISTAYSNSARHFLRDAFRTILEKSHQQSCSKTAPLSNFCRILETRLQSVFTNIYVYGQIYPNYKKAITALVYQTERNHKTMGAERIKQLGQQIEEFGTWKTSSNKKHETAKAQLQETIRVASQSISENQITLAKNQTRLDEMLEIQTRRRRKATVDYLPLLKRIYLEFQLKDSPFFTKSSILSKCNISLDSLMQWPEIQLSINISLKKSLTYYEGQLCPVNTRKIQASPEKESLEKDLEELKEFIMGYIKDQYRYPILEKLRVDYVKLQKQFAQISALQKKNDIIALKRIYGMV